jgi:hypothetical protein
MSDAYCDTCYCDTGYWDGDITLGNALAVKDQQDFLTNRIKRAKYNAGINPRKVCPYDNPRNP